MSKNTFEDVSFSGRKFEYEGNLLLKDKMMLKHPHMLLSCGIDYTMRLWDVSKNYCRSTMQLETGYSTCMIHYENKILVSGTNHGDVSVFNIEHDNKILRSFNVSSGKITAICKGPKGTIACATSYPYTIIVVDINSGKVLRKVAELQAYSVLYVGMELFYVLDKVIRTSSGTYKGHTGMIRCLIRLNDNQIATGSSDRTIRIWDIESRETVLKIQTNFITFTALCRVSDDYIAASGLQLDRENVMCMWSTRTGVAQQYFKGHEEPVTCLSYLPNMHLLVSGSEDNTVRTWDISSGKNVQTFRGHTSFIKSVTCV
jgi:WD40 repeat protein